MKLKVGTVSGFCFESITSPDACLNRRLFALHSSCQALHCTSLQCCSS
ncbi:hypothetical protein T4E_458 [Trichinella pseudospiralis]|uniref:Uncharacterized protein n=1 Tax=Trichinella pseudospiralis TaxID=6337 RepID=A0A0V0YJZ1_TRIPS|nr:hypothetical protein T4E_458 [Trichinella pseudospiralis]